MIRLLIRIKGRFTRPAKPARPARLADRIKAPDVGEGCGAEIAALDGNPAVLACCLHGLLVPVGETTPDMKRARHVCPYCKGTGR